MLGKVMKYELRACGRLLLPGFGLALALVALLRGLMSLAGLLWKPALPIAQGLALSLGPLAIIAIFILTTGYLVVRFYQGMAGSEATLTFTLPVRPSVHVLGRLAAAVVYILLGFAAALACALILIPGALRFLVGLESIPIDMGGKIASLRITDFPSGWVLSLAGLMLAFTLVAAATNLLKFYASIAIGTLFGTSRIAGSIVGYLIVNAVEGVGALLLALIPTVALMGGNLSQVQAFMDGMAVQDPFVALTSLLGYFWIMTGLVAALLLPFAVAEYLVARYIFSKRLNVA